MKQLLPSVFLLAATVAAAQPQDDHQHPAPEKLGQVHFENSCQPAVGEAFDRAVALLHSFSFGTAKQAFEAVLADDPNCTIAYWGIALTHWGNPFGGIKTGPLLENGSATVAQGLSTGTPTPRERAYLEAVGKLYESTSTRDHTTRVGAYEAAMATLQATYPDDREAATFYALAVSQMASPTDKTFAKQLQASAILEPLFINDPEHPGLAHYLIHAYDTPTLADRGLNAAQRYASIAPAAPHALHMPSHTFTRVGLWQESIDTNLQSAASALRDGTAAEALHAMDYTVYAYLQTGQDQAARAAVDEAPRVLAQLDQSVMGGAAPPVSAFFAAAAIPARYVMEHGAWSDAAALSVRSTAFPQVDAMSHFARAVGAARSGQPDAADIDIAALEALRAKLEVARDPYWTELVRIQREIAQAWTEFARGSRDAGLARLSTAADAEDKTDKAAISPGPLAPAREMLGEMLLELQQPAAALTAFQATLDKERHRFRATALAAVAAEQSGNAAAAAEFRVQLTQIANNGDQPGRPELEAARSSR